jgi:hypothetical protein
VWILLYICPAVFGIQVTNELFDYLVDMFVAILRELVHCKLHGMKVVKVNEIIGFGFKMFILGSNCGVN